jgi:uncharacterized protein (DUF433 family)
MLIRHLGTRILVRDVLEQVASGMAWETIVAEWRGNVNSDAISEAVLLASQAFRDHSEPVHGAGIRA